MRIVFCFYFFHVYNMTVTLTSRRTWIITGFLAGILLILSLILLSTLAWAHGGHGDAEAESLWNTPTKIVDIGPLFTTPLFIDASATSLPSYPWMVLSDNYGSIFSSRQWIISELLVNLGDHVKKWQKVAIINAPSNTPEIISLIASQRVSIAIANGELQWALQKNAYIEGIISNPDSSFLRAYDVKRKALDIQYEVEGKQLDAKITGLKATLEARGVVIDSKKIASSATITENLQKQETAKKFLIGKTNEAISELLAIFYNGDRNGLGVNTNSYAFYWGYNTNWLSLGITDRQKIIDIPERFHRSMQWLILKYPLDTNIPSEDLATILKTLETNINDANTIYAIISSNATGNYADNKKALLSLLSGDNGIIILQSRFIELQKWVLGVNATAWWELSQANADLIGLQQELALLESGKSLLAANKQKDYAALDGEKSLASIDLEKIKIWAKTDQISAESRVKALKNGLGEIQNSVRVSYALAPFDGTISRKNVSIGQTIDITNPIFDIAWDNIRNLIFVRFDVPVSDYKTLKKWQSIQVLLPGQSDESTKTTITRFASSVNKNDQTISVEAPLDTSHLPIGTQVRVIKSWLSGTGYLQIPKASIFEDNGESYVYKVLPDNSIKKWKIGYEIVGEFAVVTEGISADTRIVNNVGMGTWKDGQDVSNLLTKIQNKE